MKKLFLALVAMFSVLSAKAQILDFDGMPPYKLGITAGFNMPSFSGVGYDYTVGVNAGVDLMLDASDLIKDTYARAVVRYSMKGANGNDPHSTYVVREDGVGSVIATNDRTYFTTHYIEIPIHYGYSWRIDRDWTVMAETGPYLAVGVGGTARPAEESILDSHSFFSKHDASRIDYGWGLQTCLLFDQMWQLHIGYDWGFKNMTPIFLQNNGLNVGLTLYLDY